MILVIGLAVKQSILLVDGVLQRRPDGSRGIRPSLIVAACRDRVGMIVLITPSRRWPALSPWR